MIFKTKHILDFDRSKNKFDIKTCFTETFNNRAIARLSMFKIIAADHFAILSCLAITHSPLQPLYKVCRMALIMAAKETNTYKFVREMYNWEASAQHKN